MTINPFLSIYEVIPYLSFRMQRFLSISQLSLHDKSTSLSQILLCTWEDVVRHPSHHMSTDGREHENITLNSNEGVLA